MDFHDLKRKELQALCKEHKIPANLKNAEMADKLTQLFKDKEKSPIECEIEESVGIRSNDAVVDKKVKKVRFSPENELFEFTRSDRKRRGRRGTVSSRLSVEDVDSLVKLVKKRGRSVKINADYCEKRIKVVDASDDTLFADVGGDEVVEEVVEVRGRVTRSKAQIIGGEIEADAKIEALDVKLKGGRRKPVIPSSFRAFQLKAQDNDVTDALRSSVTQIESGGEVKPDGKVEAVNVSLRRGRKRSVMPSNRETLDLPKNNADTNNSRISELQVESTDFVQSCGKIEAVKVGKRRGRQKSVMPSNLETSDLPKDNEGTNNSSISERQVEPCGKIEAVKVGLRRGSRKSVMYSNRETLDLLKDNEGTGNSSTSELQVESTDFVEPCGKVEAVKVGLRRGRRKSVMPSNWETLDLPKNNEGTNTSSISELQVESTDFVEPGGKIEAVKVGLQRGSRKSMMPSSSGALDLAHHIQGAITDKSSAVQESGGNFDPDCDIQDVQLRWTRRKSLVPPRMVTSNVARNTSNSSLGKIDEAAGDTKDEQKVPEAVGILKRSRHNTLTLNELENHETAMQDAGTSVEEHETFVKQNNTRRSKRNAPNKSLSTIDEFDEDAIITDQKSEPAKRKRLHKPNEEKVPNPKRKGNRTKFTTKTSDTRKADSKVASGSNQVAIVNESDSIEALSRGGPQAIGELIPAELFVPKPTKSTRTITLNLSSDDKSVNFESEGMVQDSCVEGVKSPAMEMKNDVASSHIDVSYMVVGKVHLVGEDDVHKSAKESKESVTSPAISSSAGSSELWLSANAPICNDHNDFKTSLETKEADNSVKQSVDLVHLVSAVKDVCVQQNFHPVEPLRISETHKSLNEDPYNLGQAEIPSIFVMDNESSFLEKEVLSIENNMEMNEVTFNNAGRKGEMTSHAVEMSNVDKEDVVSPVLEMMTGIASSHFDESTISGIKSLQNYHVDSSNEFLSTVEDVNLAMEGEARGLAEEILYVKNKEVATELYSQPGYHNEMDISDLLEASSVSTIAGVASPVIEMATGIDESAISGIKISQTDHVNNSNELLSRVEDVNLAMEGKACGLAEEYIDVKNEEIATEFYSQPSYHNEMHINDLLEASSVSANAGVASPVMEMATGIDESAISGIKSLQTEHVDSSNELLSRAEDVNLAMEGESCRLPKENTDVTNEEVATELCSQPEQPGYHNETHSSELLEATNVSTCAGVASPVLEMMTGTASSHFGESVISGIKNPQNDHVDCSNALMSRVEDVNPAMEGEACGFTEENIDVTKEELATELPENSCNRNESHNKELLEASIVSVGAGIGSPFMELMTGIASSSFEKSAKSGIKSSQQEHVDSSKELLSRVEDVSLALEGEACGLAEENIDDTNEEVATQLYRQFEHSGNRNKSHSKELLEASIVSISAVASDTASNVKVKEPLSCENNIECYSASTGKHEITSQVFEITTDENRNEMQLLFATPFKTCDDSKIDETFGSKRILENTSCLGGSSVINSPYNSQRKVDEEKEKTQPLVILTTHPEKTATGSSVGNERNLLASQTKTDASFNGNTTPGSPVRKLENFSCLESISTMDKHMVINRIAIDKTCEKLRETGSLSEENTHSLGLLEANRFYLLSDEAGLDLFESDTPNVKFPESNHRVFEEPMSIEESKGEFSCDLSNASLEPGEVTVRRVLDDDKEPDEKCYNEESSSCGLLEGNRFYLLSDEAGFDLSGLKTPKHNKKESLLGAFVETISPDLEKEVAVKKDEMEADILTSNGIILSTENESDLFSNLDMQLLTGENDKNNSDMGEGESLNSLKESDVMETIQEYIDSESSMSVDFDDSVADGKSPQIMETTVKGDEVMVAEKEMDHVLMEKKNARTILIHGTPRKGFAMADKENIPPNKGLQAGDVTTLRLVKRRALQEVQFKF